MIPPFVLVSGNPGKIAEARLVLGFELEAEEVDLPEIQSLDMLEIVHGKAEAAFREVRRPLVVEEAGLELDALNGFPGPLVRWMLQAVGADGIARVGEALGNPRAAAHCLLLFYDGERTVLGEGRTEGTLIRPGRGQHGFGWDPVFLPDGGDLTFAELTGPEKLAVSHRGKAWKDLLRALSGTETPA